MKPRGHKITDEVHLALWHSRVPGRTTEEKILHLIGFYETSQGIADEMMRQTPHFETDDEGRPYIDLPDETVRFFVEHTCPKCDAFAFVEMLHTRKGWAYFPEHADGVKCPECPGMMIPSRAVNLPDMIL